MVVRPGSLAHALSVVDVIVVLSEEDRRLASHSSQNRSRDEALEMLPSRLSNSNEAHAQSGTRCGLISFPIPSPQLGHRRFGRREWVISLLKIEA